MAQYVKVAKKSELPENAGTCLEVEGHRIALFHVDGEIYALDELCPHEQAPLSDGEIENCEIACPWHGATFNLKTGECTGPPADEDLARYNVRVVGDDIEVEL